ncbi:MAG: 5-dehydro-2-deoxygluconokinase [Butyricicoccus sp.]
MKIPQGRKLELLLAGRAGIDLNTAQAGCSFAEIPYFTKSVGGSPANIVQGAARLGMKTGFLGKVARDGMGEYILETFRHAGIETAGIAVDTTGARNCIALTEIISAEQSGGYATGGNAFHHGTYLYRAGTADMLYAVREVHHDLIASSQAVMLSGTAFSQSPSREAMFEILHTARRHDVLTVLDIDYRPFGWQSRAETAQCYAQAITQCDIVIGNREEFDAVEYLSMPYNRDNEKSARALLEKGVQLVIVKDGANGSAGYTADGEIVRCGVIPTAAVKTFGSGDAYAAGLMYGLLRGKGLTYAMQLGTACASIALTTISCGDAMPDFAAAEAHRAAHEREMTP